MVTYNTGSNIALLGHGSQNSRSKLWIQVVKEATSESVMELYTAGLILDLSFTLS